MIETREPRDKSETDERQQRKIYDPPSHFLGFGWSARNRKQPQLDEEPAAVGTHSVFAARVVPGEMDRPGRPGVPA